MTAGHVWLAALPIGLWRVVGDLERAFRAGIKNALPPSRLHVSRSPLRGADADADTDEPKRPRRRASPAACEALTSSLSSASGGIGTGPRDSSMPTNVRRAVTHGQRRPVGASSP